MQPGAVKRGVIAADDSVIIRDNVRAALGDPWRIFLAVDGAEAIEYARRIEAELVLLDLRMPRMDGIAACTFIRHLPGYAAVPIVLLTAYDSPEVRRRATSAGATAIFPKPFTAAALRQHAVALVAPLQASPLRPDSVAPHSPVAESELPWDALSAGRDVLAVHRQVEEASKQRRYASFSEIMAAWRAEAQR
jgi:CheY-like chemotaxis protein